MSITTYLSHSYRPKDQDTNRAFWDYLSELDFSFFVDPPSVSHQTVHLEKRMLESSCFVAVVPYRNDSPTFKASPYMLYEIGLAIQTRRPKLILCEDRISESTLLFKDIDPEELIRYDPNEVDAIEDDIRFKLGKLKKKSLPADYVRREPSRVIGVVAAGAFEEGAEVWERLEAAADIFGLALRPIPTDFEHNALFLQEIDACDAIIFDALLDTSLNWLTSCLILRPVPTVKAVRLLPGDHVNDVKLPPIIEGTKMDSDEPVPEHTVFWRYIEDLEEQLLNSFGRIIASKPNLMNANEGLAYFRSIGRPKARFFLSNSGKQNDVVERLIPHFEQYNIELFHYKKDIDAGDLWKDRLKHELEICHGMIALIDDSYWNSDYCVFEIKKGIARKKADNKNFLLDLYKIGKADAKKLGDYSARDFNPENDDDYCHVVEKVDHWLWQKMEGQSVRRRSILPGGTREWVIDVIRQTERGLLQDACGNCDVPFASTGEVRALASERPSSILPRRSVKTLLDRLQPTEASATAGHMQNRHPLIALLESIRDASSNAHRENATALLERLNELPLDV